MYEIYRQVTGCIVLYRCGAWAYINVRSIDVAVCRIWMGRDGLQSDTMVIIYVARNKYMISANHQWLARVATSTEF